MKQALLGIVSLALALSVAQARIGENGFEIVQRYGAPTKVGKAEAGDLTNQYSSGGFFISVTFVKGKSAREMFVKTDFSEISQSELKVLLEANAGDYKWGGVRSAEIPAPSAGTEEWRSVDGRSRVAYYARGSHSFSVTTQAFIDHSLALRKEAAEKQMSKF